MPRTTKPSSRPRRPDRARAVVLLALATLLSFSPPGGLAAQEPGAEPDRREGAPGEVRVTSGPVRLSIDAQPGDESTYRFEQQVTILPPASLGDPIQATTALVLHQVARDVRGDTVVFEGTIEEIQLTVDPPQAGIPDVSRFERRGFRYGMTRHGQVRLLFPRGREPAAGPGVAGAAGDARGAGPGAGDGDSVARFDAVAAARADSVAAARYEATAARREAEHVENWLQQLGFPALPARPVRVGESWSDTVVAPAAAMMQLGGGEMRAIRTVTLEGLERSGATTIADLRMESEFELVPPPDAPAGFSFDIDGSSIVDVRFDVEGGRYLGSEGETDMVIRMSIPGGPGTAAFHVSGTSSTTLVGS